MREYNNLPATFNDRIHAFSIDFGLVMLVMLIAIFTQIHPVFGQYIKMFVTLLFWYILNVFPSHFKPGTSLGKNNSKIIILTEDYKTVSIKVIYIREVFILLLTLFTGGLYIPISFALLNKRIDKRAIHDLLLNTRVVRTTPFIGKSE